MPAHDGIKPISVRCPSSTWAVFLFLQMLLRKYSFQNPGRGRKSPTWVVDAAGFLLAGVWQAFVKSGILRPWAMLPCGLLLQDAKAIYHDNPCLCCYAFID